MNGQPSGAATRRASDQSPMRDALPIASHQIPTDYMNLAKGEALADCIGMSFRAFEEFQRREWTDDRYHAIR